MASELPTTTVPLNDGVDMPIVGVAAFRRDSLKELREALTACVEGGLRHFEISDLYGNASVAVPHILTHEVPRNEFYFTLKVRSFFLHGYCDQSYSYSRSCGQSSGIRRS